MKYSYGYDPILHGWIVGIENERGTIENPIAVFITAEEAKEKCQSLQ